MRTRNLALKEAHIRQIAAKTSKRESARVRELQVGLVTRLRAGRAWGCVYVGQCNHTRKNELNRYLVHALEQPPI